MGLGLAGAFDFIGSWDREFYTGLMGFFSGWSRQGYSFLLLGGIGSFIRVLGCVCVGGGGGGYILFIFVYFIFKVC